MSRPNSVTDEHLIFLDDLRESGVTNMYGSGAYLEDYYDLTKETSKEILLYWMETFGRDDR